MSDYPRFTINRALVLILPNQPFADWAAAADPGPAPLRLTLEELREEADAFLLPESVMEDEGAAVKWIEKRWQTFFEHFLNGQYVDEVLWPQGRSLKMFRQWFTIQFHSMVYDMADTPIVHEDWEDEGEEGTALQ